MSVPRASSPILGRYLCALILVLAWLATSQGQTQTDKNSQPAPLWELDLSKFGYQTRPVEKPGEGSDRFWRARHSLLFTAENILETSFQVHNSAGALSRRDQPAPTDPYHLVAVFLDPQNGEVLHKADWPVRKELKSFLFAAQKGQFILGLGKELTLYSPDLTTLKGYEVGSAYEDILSAAEGPAADSLLILYPGGPQVQYSWMFDLLDTANLSLLASWKQSKDQSVARGVSGRRMAWNTTTDLYLTDAGAEPKVLQHAAQQYCGHWNFLTTDTIAGGVLTEEGCTPVRILTTEGKTVQDLHFETAGVRESPIASRNGKVFAIVAYASVRRSLRPTVRVYRLGRSDPLMTVEVPLYQSQTSISMGGPNDFLGWWSSAEWGGIALSPDGYLLAIRAGPNLSVYRVLASEP